MRVRINDPYSNDKPHELAEIDGTIMYDETHESYPSESAVQVADGSSLVPMTAWAIEVETFDDLLALGDCHEEGDALQISRDHTGHREFVIDLTMTSI